MMVKLTQILLVTGGFNSPVYMRVLAMYILVLYITPWGGGGEGGGESDALKEARGKKYCWWGGGKGGGDSEALKEARGKSIAGGVEGGREGRNQMA